MPHWLQQELRPTLRVAIPLVIAELGWMAMGLVDTIMVGHLPYSARAIGAVGLGGIIFYSIVWAAGGLLLGLDTLVSQAFGAGKLRDCNRALINGLYLGMALTPALVWLVRFIAGEMGSFGVAPEIVALMMPFVNVLSWSTLPLIMYFILRRYLQATNQVKVIAFALLTANLVNLVGNWLFVYGHLGFPALGVRGSAYSTLLSRGYMSLLLLFAALHVGKSEGAPLLGERLWPDLSTLKELLRLGAPASGQIAFEVGIFALVTAFCGRLGAISLAGHQIALNVVSTTFMVPLGISSAAAVRVGQHIGARRPDSAAHAGWTALLLGAGFMSCAAVVLWTLGRPIALLFTNDEQVIAIAVRLLIVCGFFQLFDGLQIVATGALRGAGQTVTPMVTVLVGYWALGMPLSWYLGFQRHWGAIGLWMGLSIALIAIGSTLLVVWWRSSRMLAVAIRSAEMASA